MASPTAFVFTDNLSAAVEFYGIAKIKVDDLTDGGSIIVKEERIDGTYETAVGRDNAPLVITHPQTFGLFELYGNYKVERTSDTYSAGYVK